MVKEFLIGFGLVTSAVIAGCNSGVEQNVQPPGDPLAENQQPPTGENCYGYLSGDDSIFLELDISGKKIRGNLFYQFYGKDKNSGRLENAVMNGDTLLADYKFMSEGKISVRQVSFLLRDNIAREGYSEMKEEKGKMIFKNPYSIRFDKSFPLSRIECPE